MQPRSNQLKTLALVIFMAAGGTLAYAISGYLTNFKNTYTLAAYPNVNPLYTCATCHTNGNTSLFTPYGMAFAAANHSFTAIESQDSDNDNFTNLEEIQAGTLPGDAASHPAPGDTTPPSITAFSIPANSSSLTISITSLSATDTVGVTGYYVSESSATPAAGAAGWSTTAPSSYTFTSAGAKTLYAWAKDAAGNVSASQSASTTITLVVPDTTPPTVTAFSIPANGASLTISITSLSATDTVGVTGYYVTESSTAPAAGAAAWSTSAPSSYTFTSAGAKTLYAWAKDAAGNVSASQSASTTITLVVPDTAPPTVTAFSIPVNGASLTISITSLSATDTVGVTGYYVSESSTAPAAGAAGWATTAPSSYTFTNAGAKTLYAWAKDAAGNVSASQSASTTITLVVPDTAPPTVTAFSIPANSSSLNISITSLSATDTVGVTGYYVSESSTAPAAGAAGWATTAPSSYTFTNAGAKTLYAWAKDAAGNVSASQSASTTITLVVPDTAPPTVTAFSIPANGASLTISITSLSATDTVGVTGYYVSESSTAPAAGAAGWATTAPSSYTFTSAGAKTLYAWAKDAAGNVSASQSASTTITLIVPDTTPPAVTAFSIPANGASLTISITSFSATDAVGVTGYMVTESPTVPNAGTPGWSATAPANYVVESAGSKTLHGWAKDGAGNISARASAGIVITLPPPAALDLSIWQGTWFRVTLMRRDQPNRTGYLSINSWDPETKKLQANLYTQERREQNWNSVSIDLIYTSGGPLKFLFSFDYSELFGFAGSLQARFDRSGRIQAADLKVAGVYLTDSEESEREEADNSEDEVSEDEHAKEIEADVLENLITMRGKLISARSLPASIQSAVDLDPYFKSREESNRLIP